MILINLFKNTTSYKNRLYCWRRYRRHASDPIKFQEMREYWTNWKKNNKAKQRASQIKWNMANPDRIKSAGLKYEYGITIEIYNNMVAQQNGLCAICGQLPTSGRKILCVDHCHGTKKVRGLLCHTCNVGLGYFEDDVSRLEAAIAYLKKHST